MKTNLRTTARMRTGIVALAAIMSTHGAYAAPTELDSGLVSETEFFDNLPQVASVTRLAQVQSETPAAVTVIDNEMIRASGARDLADLFRLVPGFQVATPRGQQSTVTYHGLGDEYSRRMQILVDGRSVYGALFGHVIWSGLGFALEDIDRIEVIRGPNSVTYGANAFLGAINIITRHAAQDRGTAFKAAGGNHDIRDALVRHGTGFKGGDIRVTAGYRADDGLEGLPDDHQNKYANVRADLQPSVRDTLQLQVGISHTKKEEGFYDTPFAPPVPTTINSNFEQIHWQRQLAGGDELSLQFYRIHRSVDFNYLTDPINLGPPFGTIQIPVSYDGIATRYDFELQHMLSQWANWRLVWGVGMRRDGVQSEPFLATTETIYSQASRLFSNAEWRATQNTIINAGAMLERTDFTGTDLSPRLALNHHLTANDTVRIVMSKAQRIPSFFEELGDQRFYYQGFLISQPQDSRGGLKPETMRSVELGYLGQRPAWKTTLDVRIYRDRITDLISEVGVPSAALFNATARSYRNEGEVVVQGVDMALTYRPGHSSRVILNYARMHASSNEVGINAASSQQQRLDSVPDYSGSLLAMQRFPGAWYGSIGYYWVDNMLWLSSGDAVGPTKRLDLRIAHRLRFGDTRSEVALVVQNAADRRYEEFSHDQYFARRVFLTLGMDFF